MKAPRLILIFAAVVFAVIMIYSFSNVDIEDKYASNIEKERTEKDQEFKNGEDSPLNEAQEANFEHLNYYPVNKQYKITAQFELNPMKETISLAYTDGTEKIYLKYGFAYFTLNGKEQKLAILKPTFYEDEEYLFLPFYDETSTIDTYGGGRYLDLSTDVGKTIEIDFNRAYNPYCAYNKDYRCPIPPKENKITVSVEAGEKKFDLTH